MFWKNLYESISRLFDSLWKFAGKTTSILVAFVFIVFSLGTLFGYFIALSSNLRPEMTFLLLIPPILGIFAYYYRTFATLLFVGFIIVLLI